MTFQTALRLLVLTLPLAAVAAPPAGKADYPPLPKPGTKVPLGPDHYFTYGFAERAKLGSSIVRVEIFAKDGTRDGSFVVKGDADMPSMRGAHATGDKEFALSNKKIYLLPINLVMPGGWEVKLTFLRNGATVLRGAWLFDL